MIFNLQSYFKLPCLLTLIFSFILFVSTAQIYTAENDKTIEISEFESSPSNFFKLSLNIGLYLDKIKFRSSTFQETHKFLQLTYFDADKFLVNGVFGPANMSIDGNFFLKIKDNEKQKTIHIKTDAFTNYFITRNVFVRKSIAPHILLGNETIRLADGESFLGPRLFNYLNTGIGISYISHSNVRMLVDKVQVNSVLNFFQVNLDLINSFSYLHTSNSEFSSHLLGGRLSINGRWNTVCVGKKGAYLNYMLGMAITTEKSGFTKKDKGESNLYFGPVYGFGIGRHFK
jgi:hypothetical protein